MASSSGSTNVCFNSTCKQALEVPRQGWLCRTGDFAELCDRCASAFKEGKFCDTYHLNASGWRCCESCGKQIHCGCIVSFHMFILLDAGGIECLSCAKTEYILTPNPTWPSTSHFLHGPSERIRDLSSKNWRSIAGSGPVPWRQTPSLFNAFKDQPELQFTSSSLGQSTTVDPSERFLNDTWRVNAPETIGDRARVTGIQYDGQHNLFKDVSYKSFFHSNPTPLSSLPATFVAHDKGGKGTVSGTHVQQLCPPPPSVGKRCSNNNEAGLCSENQAHNTKGRGETRARHQLLPRYWPRITDQELQQISGGSNAKITPLFEKVLSASDAGKIGRLVLPKKCAEAYLPPITQPEGYPLVIQDLKGKDWVLQYRFWPNNNSRMYVLEGVTPCIQSMQLQAGDTVTFSRLEPEGKLVMGFRKAPVTSPSDMGNDTTNARFSTNEESSKDCVAVKSRNPDGTWSDVDKVCIRAKRKKGGKMCSTSKHLKLKEEDIFELSITLDQVQGLLQPPLANAPTIVLIEGVEFEAFQEAPTIGSPLLPLTDNVASLCSTEEEPTPECPDHMLPMINHENPDSLTTTEGLDALADLAATTRHPRHKPGCTCIVCIQPPSGTKHKSTCTCNVCLAVKRSTPSPIIHHDQTHSEKVGNSVTQNSPQTQFLYADIIRYTQMGVSNENHKTGACQSFENDPNRDKSSNLCFKSQNIDLNIQPERDEESSPVSDSMGIMRVVQESTHRYIRQQKLSVNGISGDHGIHDL